jgi:polysaccharide biosynthesis/export protein
MTAVVRPGMAILVALLLAGCNLPRGAALQSEVLAVATDDSGAPVAADFAVVDVTRATLLTVAEWPAPGVGGYNWIERQAQPASLLIAPGDTIGITVWDADENSLLSGPGQRAVTLQEMQVSASGEVFLPFVGNVRLAGMSQAGARERVEERYAETIPSAQVQLQVEPGRANTANLVAGVGSPGVYPLADRDVTILTLLAMGGGVNPNLGNPQVRLFRGDDVYGIALDRLYDDPGLDTTLAGGDRVIVEAEDRVFLSLGAAGSESRHLFPQDLVTALEAMAIIGGVQDSRADPQGILVLRDYPVRTVDARGVDGPPEERMVFTIDLTSADGLFSAGNFRILPNDLVYVTESPITAAGSVIGILSSVFGLTRQVQSL